MSKKDGSRNLHRNRVDRYGRNTSTNKIWIILGMFLLGGAGGFLFIYLVNSKSRTTEDQQQRSGKRIEKQITKARTLHDQHRHEEARDLLEQHPENGTKLDRSIRRKIERVRKTVQNVLTQKKQIRKQYKTLSEQLRTVRPESLREIPETLHKLQKKLNSFRENHRSFLRNHSEVTVSDEHEQRIRVLLKERKLIRSPGTYLTPPQVVEPAVKNALEQTSKKLKRLIEETKLASAYQEIKQVRDALSNTPWQKRGKNFYRKNRSKLSNLFSKNVLRKKPPAELNELNQHLKYYQQLRTSYENTPWEEQISKRISSLKTKRSELRNKKRKKYLKKVKETIKQAEKRVNERQYKKAYQMLKAVLERPLANEIEEQWKKKLNDLKTWSRKMKTLKEKLIKGINNEQIDRSFPGNYKHSKFITSADKNRLTIITTYTNGQGKTQKSWTDLSTEKLNPLLSRFKLNAEELFTQAHFNKKHGEDKAAKRILHQIVQTYPKYQSRVFQNVAQWKNRSVPNHGFVFHKKSNRWLVKQVGLNINTTNEEVNSFRSKYESGRPKKIFWEDRKERLHGEYRVYHPNGSLKIKTVYRHGQPTGPRIHYDKRGIPFLHLTFRNEQILIHPFPGKNQSHPLYPRSRPTIRETITEYFPEPSEQKIFGKKSYSEKKYKRKYTTMPPYKAGALTEDYMQEGVDRVNLYRFLLGLPDDVELSTKFSKTAQHGAVVLERIDKLTHHPERPDDMGKPFFKRAHRGTSKSNLSKGGNVNVVNIVDRFMDDSDPSNIDVVGHRRWIMNPKMKKTGFGQTSDFGAMYAHDQSRSSSFERDYVAFPPTGYYPLKLFRKRFAWNVSFQNSSIEVPDSKEEISVQVFQLNNQLSIQNSLSLNHLSVSHEKMGDSASIIFRPDFSETKLEADEIYLAVIRRTDPKNPSVILSYIVHFM